MSIQCPTCGNTLPKDGARFCSKCGAPVSSQPLGAQPLPASKNAPATSREGGQVHKQRLPLREQIAHQPAFQPPRRPRPTQDALPQNNQLSTSDWSDVSPPLIEDDRQESTPKKIEASGLVDAPTGSLPGVQDGQSPEVRQVTKKDEESVDADEADMPTVVVAPRKSPVRELHVKVWEQDGSPSSLDEPVAPSAKGDAVGGEQKVLAEFPTMPMVVEGVPPEMHQGATKSAPILGVQTPRFEEVTQFDTKRLPQQVNPPTRPVEPSVSQRQPPAQPQLQSTDRGVAPQPVALGQYTPPFAQPMFPPTRRSRSVVPLLLAVILVCGLIAGGLWAWIYFFQPFSIAPVTQPQQKFQNAELGVALSYPNGWTVQLNQGNAMANFADSTHTARFSVAVVAASGQDAGQYVLQEAKQLGISGAKPGPSLSFAKESWQQVQGNVVQGGVNYTETLLVTMHANRLYSVVQMAPQATYTDEDQLIFSTVRSSFQFLI